MSSIQQKIAEIVCSLVHNPYPYYNLGLLPDEEGYDSHKIQRIYRYQEKKDEATNQLLTLFESECEAVIGKDTATYHTETGISDAADMNIDIAISDLINWVKIGQTINIIEKDRLKNIIIERVKTSLNTVVGESLRQSQRKLMKERLR